MSLFKRGNVWWSYFYKEAIPHQHSTGASNRRQAEAIEAKLKEERNNQRFQIVKTDPEMRLGELAVCFIASGSVRPHHLYHLKFLLPYFADKPVLRIARSLTDEFRKAVRERRTRRQVHSVAKEELPLLLERRQEEALLIQLRGKPVRIVKRDWQAALRRASLRHIRFHDLRHTCNTRLMDAVVIQDNRMALMGSSSGLRVHATCSLNDVC